MQDILDVSSDFGLIIQWYLDDYLEFAVALAIVLFLSNCWSIFILWRNKFNKCISFICGIIGLGSVLAFFKVLKKI